MELPQSLPGFITERAKVLTDAGIDSAREEVEWILCHVLDVNRLNLYLHGARLLDESSIERVDSILKRRATRYPLQYILEEVWFYGRRFYVSPAVMVPAPETEGLCEAALTFIRTHDKRQTRILDIGTGSGVIAVTMASELDDSHVLAIDISEKALSVAEKNARDLNVSEKIEFRRSDLFSGVNPGERFDLILSNPPYIRDSDYADLPPEVKADPKAALLAGPDGLDVVREILKHAPSYLAEGGRIMFEVGLGQADSVAELTNTDPRYHSFTCLKDLNDIDRLIILACEG